MNLEGKELDDFFRKGLSNEDIPFEEAHWERLERRLEKKKRRRTITWITVSGIAAMLLLTLSISYLLFNNENAQPVETVVKKSKNPGTITPSDTYNTSPSNEKTLEETRDEIRNLTQLTISSKRSREDNILQSKKSNAASEGGNYAELTTPTEAKEAVNPQLIASESPETPQTTMPESNQPETMNQPGLIQEIQKKDSTLASTTNQSFKGSPFSVSFLAGPDINGVNNLKSNRGGISAGIVVNYKLSKALSISTGALYAKKLYNSEFEYYKPNSNYKFPTDPKLVNADCRVLDIPLNINYTAFSRSKDAVALSAGISSYIMLNEGYSFTYETPATRGPKSYYISNKNKHYLGILNFGVAYERKVSDEVSIGFQPYLKLPVTDIGYGNVKLLSTGVLTSVKLNLSSKTK